MSGAGQQIKDKPWLIPAAIGATALTAGAAAPLLAGGAAAAGAAAASGGAAAAGTGAALGGGTAAGLLGGGTAAGMMGAGAGTGLAGSLLAAPTLTPAVTAGLGSMGTAGLGAGGFSAFGAGTAAGPLALQAMSASPVAGGMTLGQGMQMANRGMRAYQAMQPQQQPQPQGMGQTPMSMAASNQMPVEELPQFNPPSRRGGTIGGLEFMKRRRGLA